MVLLFALGQPMLRKLVKRKSRYRLLKDSKQDNKKFGTRNEIAKLLYSGTMQMKRLCKPIRSSKGEDDLIEPRSSFVLVKHQLASICHMFGELAALAHCADEAKAG